MTLDATARERLDDVRELEPTSNGELAKRWGMESGREVARYLRDELDGYVYRDYDSRIRVVADAEVDESPVADRESESSPQSDESPSGSSGMDAEGVDGPSDGHSGDSDVVAMPADEFDTAIQEVAGEARHEGYEEAKRHLTRASDPEPIESVGTESKAREVKPVGRNPPCPSCGCMLMTSDRLEEMLGEMRREEAAKFVAANEARTRSMRVPIFMAAGTMWRTDRRSGSRSRAAGGAGR